MSAALLGILCLASIANEAHVIAAPRQVAERTRASGPDFRVTCNGAHYRWGNPQADPDGDLNRTPHPHEEANGAMIRSYKTDGNGPANAERRALRDFHNGFRLGTVANTNDDNKLYDHFVGGNGTPLDFPASSDMARIIGSSQDFVVFATAFEQAIRDQYISKHTLCGFDGNGAISRNRPAYIKNPLFAWAVMGGYHGLQATVTITNTTLDVRYVIVDHFGAGVSDATSTLPGLPGLYYLQHYRSAANKYQPFIWQVEIARRVRGAW